MNEPAKVLNKYLKEDIDGKLLDVPQASKEGYIVSQYSDRSVFGIEEDGEIRIIKSWWYVSRSILL